MVVKVHEIIWFWSKQFISNTWSIRLFLELPWNPKKYMFLFSDGILVAGVDIRNSMTFRPIDGFLLLNCRAVGAHCDSAQYLPLQVEGWSLLMFETQHPKGFLADHQGQTVSNPEVLDSCSWKQSSICQKENWWINTPTSSPTFEIRLGYTFHSPWGLQWDKILVVHSRNDLIKCSLFSSFIFFSPLLTPQQVFDGITSEIN